MWVCQLYRPCAAADTQIDLVAQSSSQRTVVSSAMSKTGVSVLQLDWNMCFVAINLVLLKSQDIYTTCDIEGQSPHQGCLH